MTYSDNITPINDSLNIDDVNICGASALCAIAATKAALIALITEEFPDPVGLILPEGEVPYFPLAMESLSEFYAMAGIVKNADMVQDIGAFNTDKDHIGNGATIMSSVYPAPPATGIKIQAGDDFALDDRPILDKASKQHLNDICHEICAQYALPADLIVILSVVQ